MRWPFPHSPQITDADAARLRLNLLLPEDKPFQYKTHPNCDKRLFTDESAIGLKAPERPFPLNSDQGVLKYRLATTDDTLIPLSSMHNMCSLYFAQTLIAAAWMAFAEI
jgi:hypothetical protein